MIEAKSAGEALISISDVLLQNGVIDGGGHNELHRVGGALKGRKAATDWSFEIPTGSPITFAKVDDRSGLTVIPRIVARVAVLQGHVTKPPFSNLDVALELQDEMSKTISRWHIDLANEGPDGWQDGPLVHLQYGGHNSGERHLDHPLKAPRWCHPPMEIALLCEMVAANFYPQQWGAFRDDPSWARPIKLFETLCYTQYLEILKRHVGVSGSPSSLCSMWACNWA